MRKVVITGASGAELKEGEHYTVAYEANTDPGVATVTVTGVGTASSETHRRASLQWAI